MLIVPGRAALSAARRARVLAKARTTCRQVTSITAQWVHLVVTERPLSEAEAIQLEQMLTYGPSGEPGPEVDVASSVETLRFFVTPRIGTTSPWSSKATDIAHVCGLGAIRRIERAIAYVATGTGMSLAGLSGALADRMTESVIVSEADLVKVVAHGRESRPLGRVKLGCEPAKTLREASTRLGLALADDEIEYLVARYQELGRDPTDVELMMFAQANSEHCRHKVFNAEWHIAGQKQEASLFELIKRTTKAAPEGVLSAYKDNAAVVEGHEAARLFPDADGVYRAHTEPSHILGKVETHNHPTAISPFPGAATGSGGEIRDEGATGRGAKPKAGLVGFAVSDLRLPGQLEMWEPVEPLWIGSPSRIASALDIMTDGPLGAAAFNNEFGRPAILGYFRTFEAAESATLARGYHKPVMLAGGIGAIRPGHVAKAKVPEGAALIVLGGPAFLIGLGGGAASSLAQGASAEDLDFASVQRDNAEIQRRCQEVIDRCWALGGENPILSIHDVGAGGLSNAMPELVHDAGLGARLELRAIPTGEPELSPLELWCNEAQERYVLAIAVDRVADFRRLCERERAPWASIGTATADGRIVVADRNAPSAPPVDVPLELILGKPPRMVRRAEPLAAPRAPLAIGGSVADALDRVLGLPTVADKTFLVTIGDRTVGGMVSRDPMIGRFQVPVADCAITLAGFDSCAGEVMALGERPPVALLDAAAASRLAIGEAITNLAAAPIGPLSRIKLSCNWMAAAGHPGEDARLYAAVKAASDCALALGVAIPVGKDSMSMRTVWQTAVSSVVMLPVADEPTLPYDVVPDQTLAAQAEAQLAALEQEIAGEAPMSADDAELMRLGRAAAKPDERSAFDSPTTKARNAALEDEASATIGRAMAVADAIDRETTQKVGGAVPVALSAETTQKVGVVPPPKQPTTSRAVVAPVTLVVTAFGSIDDARLAVTPELRGEGRELLLVDLGGGKHRLGGSCLAQVYRQLGDTPPDLDDPKRLAACYGALQLLVAEQKLAAYHDRSDGGLIVTLLEMAFASGLGLEIDTSALAGDPLAVLFSEELGAVVEVAAADVAHVRTQLAATGAVVTPVGRAVKGDRIRVVHGGATVLDRARSDLRARWSHVTYQMAQRRDDPRCAIEEHTARISESSVGLTAELTFSPTPPPMINASARPRVAILREQGVNGQVEMAAAFTRAGFDAVDVHMTDLVAGRASLADCRGAVACGGFSFGDVLGAGRGWAATFRYNARARDALAAFNARSDTFLLGVCNGCQMLGELADQLPGAAGWPRFVRNRSEQFEARLVLLRIEPGPSIFFRNMAGSRIPVASAHGEGRAELDADRLAALERAGLVAARFVDGAGAVASSYPANPNGSPAGVASLTTPDGRITIMMPHPERVFRTVQMSWHPPTWAEDSPWMQMFYNARAWVG